MAFADDIALICEDSDEMKSALVSLENYCRRKILTFGKGRPSKATTHFLKSEVVEEVKHFKYLGLTFTVGLSIS